MSHPDATPIVQNVPEPTGPVLTKTDLAGRWQVSRKTVERIALRKTGGLRHFHIAGQMRFRLRDVEEFEQRRLTRQRAF